MAGWLETAVVYEVYPRSFQDSDGDGVGDLRGITSRLDHLQWLGVDAIWLAPIYASPGADFGYDVSDHTAVAPELGTLADFDALLSAAHERGIRIVMDLVVSHTSIEHAWFRERPDFYVHADGDVPPNNWIASFGGPAWSPDPRGEGLYLHSFYPEQPDLDWRNPAVREAMGDVVRFWADRGVDGFRVDAVDRLVKDLDLRDDPAGSEPFPLPVHPDQQRLDLVHSRDAPEIDVALAALRQAAGDLPMVAEVYLPSPRARRYLDHFDAAFSFELLHARWARDEIAAGIRRSLELGRTAWALSNHDFPRVASRWGEGNARAAAVLLMTLGGVAFVYQGEEIGMVDGPGASPPLDRYGRDGCRAPMQWTGERFGGFTTGEPWLPLADSGARNVESERADPDSILHLFRELIAVRREMEGEPELLEAPEGLLAYRRAAHVVVIGFGAEPVPPAGFEAARPVLRTDGAAMFET